MSSGPRSSAPSPSGRRIGSAPTTGCGCCGWRGVWRRGPPTPKRCGSAPGGAFSAAGAGGKTNLLFFTKGQPTERSWTVSREEIGRRNYDLKAVNPNAKREQDTRTPDELLDLIEAKGREVAEALATLRHRTNAL